MNLKQLFSRDINRAVNPAIVVGDRNANTIKIEIEEYVFTPDLIDELYTFLFDIFNKKDGKTGIWIDGFYGSGKSHFIKYAYYCIQADTSDDAFDHYIKNAQELAAKFSDATPSNIKQIQKKVQASQIDNIMFNIDSVSGQKDDKEKITKIIFNQFNQFRGYNSKNIPLAILVEKHLNKLGKFEAFKAEISKAIGDDWNKNASTIIALKSNAVLDIVKGLDPSIDLESLKRKLINPDDISIIGDLIPEFVEYLSEKPDNYRLLFLIDEVSQYVGDNSSLLLNLQTIIEEIGANCNNQIWMATTAQQTLDQLVGNNEIDKDQFGKILGRFDTKISLQSQDAAYITKKRILDKNSNGIGELKSFYDQNKEVVQNQFHFSHELYRGYEDYDEFLLSYPFVPYQFKLISEVFDSFSKLGYVDKGVKNSERSILGITHYTIGKQADNSVGYFIPFDAFFNGQFRKNLTNSAMQIMRRALDLDFVNSGSFEERVVYVLFMISNLLDEMKIVFPTNLDNLTILLMNQPDVNKLELQNDIQGVLDKLLKNNIIREEDGQYHFFKEDEIEVANLIQNTAINTDDRLSRLEKDIFQDMVGLHRKFTFENNAFNLALSFDDKQIYPNGDVNVKFSFFDKEDIHSKAMGMNKDDMVICLNVPLNKNNNLMKDYTMYVKTAKYIRKHSDTATGIRKATLDEFAYRNRTKLDDLKIQFKEILKNAPIISAQSVIAATEIIGSEPKLRYQEALKLHFGFVYKKHHLSNSYAQTNDQLKVSANDNQTTLPDELTSAESELNNWIDRTGSSVTLDDIIKKFGMAPFGWKDLAVMDMLIKIAKRNKKEFKRHNEKIDYAAFYQFGIKSPERKVIVIHAPDVQDPGDVKKAKANFKSIFNESIINDDGDANLVFDEIIKKLQPKIDFIKPLMTSYSGHTFSKHFIAFVNVLEDLVNTRDTGRLFEKLAEKKDELQTIRDHCEQLSEFVKDQFKDYETIRGFAKENAQNFSNLDPDDIEKSEKLKTYFSEDDLPFDSFPQIKKIYTELVKAIAEHKNKLKEKAKTEYKAVYKIVEESAKATGVSEDIFPDWEKMNQEITAEDNISKLELMISNSGTKQAQWLKAISDKSGKETVTFKISSQDLPVQIETKEDLNRYIDQLRAKLEAELKDGKTIIIE